MNKVEMNIVIEQIGRGKVLEKTCAGNFISLVNQLAKDRLEIVSLAIKNIPEN